MTSKVNAAKIFALAMVLALPLVLTGCGKKPAPAVPSDNTPSAQTPAGSLTPANESIDGSGNLFDNVPQSNKEIKNDADIEAILNNIDNDNSKAVQDVDDSDLYNF